MLQVIATPGGGRYSVSCSEAVGTIFFWPALLSTLTPLSLPSSVSLAYFIPAVPVSECLGKHSCVSSAFPLVILNGTFLFSQCEIVCNLGRSFDNQNQIKLNSLLNLTLF